MALATFSDLLLSPWFTRTRFGLTLATKFIIWLKSLWPEKPSIFWVWHRTGTTLTLPLLSIILTSDIAPSRTRLPSVPFIWYETNMILFFGFGANSLKYS